MIVTKICALEEFGECAVSFIPKVEWQLCCSKDHASRRRWLNRKARIKVALAIMKETVGDPLPAIAPEARSDT